MALICTRTPGRRPRTPAKNGARVRRFRGVNTARPQDPSPPAPAAPEGANPGLCGRFSITRSPLTGRLQSPVPENTGGSSCGGLEVAASSDPVDGGAGKCGGGSVAAAAEATASGATGCVAEGGRGPVRARAPADSRAGADGAAAVGRSLAESAAAGV